MQGLHWSHPGILTPHGPDNVGDGESKKLSVRAELVQNRPGSGVACVMLHQTLSFCLLWHNITD